MDFITDLPLSKQRGNVYDTILVVVDRYTKGVRYIPTTKKITAPQLEELLMKEVFLRFGAPDGAVTDQSSVFTSNFWSQVCYSMKVKRRLSTAFHPQTDGQTERQNQTLEHYLRVYCCEQQDDWAELLPVAEFAYMQSQHKTLGCSPFYATYGYHPTLELTTEDGAPTGEVPKAKERVKKIYELRESLSKRWQSLAESQAKTYNKKHQPQTFQEKDLVMLSAKNLKVKKPNCKLSDKAIGPFRIRARIGKQAYRLAMPSTYRIHSVFHVSLLELYKQRTNDSDLPEYPLPELIEDEEEYPVKRILQKRTRKGVKEYLVRWAGYPPEYDQWVPEQDMKGLEELRDAFEHEESQSRKSRKTR